MADIFQMLVDVLKISPQHVSEYATQGALYQMFYLFIFPTAFIILFIYILSYRIMKHHFGLRVILAMIIYAFIILQGYYNLFVTLSKFWLFGLIFLGFIFMLLGRGDGGGVGGAKRLLQSSGLAKRLKEKASGREGQLVDDIKGNLGKLKSLSSESGAFGMIDNSIKADLDQLETIVRDSAPFGTTAIWGKKYQELRKQYQNIKADKEKEKSKKAA